MSTHLHWKRSVLTLVALGGLAGVALSIGETLPGHAANPVPAAPAPVSGTAKAAAPVPFDSRPLAQDKRVLHALNRLSFGPRPGDVEQVQNWGLDKWIEQQLAPDVIADDDVTAKLARLTGLQDSPTQLMTIYTDERKQKKVKKQAKKQTAAATTQPAALTTGDTATPAMPVPEMQRNASIELVGELETAKFLRAVESRRQLQEVLVDFWSNHFNLDVKKGPVRVLKIADERDVIRPHVLGKFRDLLGASAKSPAMLFYLDNFRSTGTPAPQANNQTRRNNNMRRNNNAQRNNIIRRNNNEQRLLRQQARALRQQQRRMPRATGGVRVLNPIQFVPGSAATLNGPTVNLLSYSVSTAPPLQLVDLTDSTLPNTTPANTGDATNNAINNANTAAPLNGTLLAAAPAPAKGKKKGGGINENYAREIMELHTLGVDGGYTQKDVQEVARCFTGWSYSQQTGRFEFRARQHDGGQKVVLGHVIPAGGGIQDGERVLDILASHPSTAHFVARKLCVRFVADEPPAALVERVAKTFLDTGGDLKEVVKSIITSPEFFSAGAYRAKIKSPFEYVVSATRALGGNFDVPDPNRPAGRRLIVGDGQVAAGRKNGAGKGKGKGAPKTTLSSEVADMGEPLFSCQPPTGYSEDSRHWVSAGSLIARLNFALALTGDHIAEVSIPPQLGLTTPPQGATPALVDQFSAHLLGSDISKNTRAIIARQVTPTAPASPAKLAALMLGSPEFQRR